MDTNTTFETEYRTANDVHQAVVWAKINGKREFVQAIMEHPVLSVLKKELKRLKYPV